MASASEFTKFPPNPEEILKQVKSFVKGSAHEPRAASEDLVNPALFLLQTLPSARHAVLEYLGSVFDEAVETYIQRQALYGDVNTHVPEGASTEGVVHHIQGVLLGAVKNNPQAWAPIVSTWSIDLLGQISSKYSNQYIERRSSPTYPSLNELLQMWMTCSATKTLIEIASESFSSIVSTSPEVCVDSLLEASVKYSPYFDWVVAHIGSCFPQTIITRVLLCGLKDFSVHGTTGADVSTESKVPKMASVVGILGHLAAQHGRIIQQAIVEMFTTGLSSGDETSSTTIPFLLHLASLSPMLHRAIIIQLANHLSPATINQIATVMAKRKLPQGQDKESLMALVIHLLLTSDDVSLKLLQFLLDTAFPSQISDDVMDTDQKSMFTDKVRAKCEEILTSLVMQLEKAVHSKSTEGSRSGVPFITSMLPHTQHICQVMINARSAKRREIASRLVSCLAVSGGEACAADILASIVMSSTTTDQLSSYLRIQHECVIKYKGIMETSLQHVLDGIESKVEPSATMKEKEAQKVAQALQNLTQILQWEKANHKKNITYGQMVRYLQQCLTQLTGHLYHSQTKVTTVTLKLINEIGLPPKLQLPAILTLCCAFVDCVFRSLCLEDVTVKVSQCKECQSYLEQLTCYPTAQKTVIRLLMEGALSKGYSCCLGAKQDAPDPPSIEVPSPGILQHNLDKQTSSQPHAVAFHGGVIGQGLKPPPRPCPFSNEEQFQNQQIFMEILAVSSCHRNTVGQSNSSLKNEEKKLSNHIAKFLALQFIELVTPDVMYNGIPWPEEEFQKVTVERDLLVRNMFENHPVLWSLMEFIATGAGAMCYCSVILRSLMATLLCHWERSRDKAAANSPWQLQASCKVIDYMRMGDLLPPPLCYTGELLEFLSPYEVYLLLINLWRYMKENPPVPEPRDWNIIGCDPKHTEVIRAILHANIDKVGHLYSRFFCLKPH